MSQRNKFLLKLLILLLIFFALSALVQNFLHLNLRQIQSYVASFGPIAPFIYFIMLVLGLCVPFNPIPDYAVVLSASLIFPPSVSIFSTFFAHTASLAINYIVGKKYGWKMLDIFAKQSEMDYGHNLAKRISPGEVFTLRWILPLTAIGIDIVSYAAGMAKMNFAKFFVASIIPWTALSIIFFVSSSYFKGLSMSLALVPSITIILASGILYKTLNSRITK